MKSFLNKKYLEYANSQFIENDPICIPHSFTKRQDIEIAGFFAAIFAWGRRETIISKSKDLMRLMNFKPYEFIKSYSSKQFYLIIDFKHRTFNGSDLDFYIRAFQKHYQNSDTLETAFIPDGFSKNKKNIEPCLNHFYQNMIGLVPHEKRNLKHVSAPIKKASCKRLCMYLRWMVRKDEVDIGIWNRIQPHQLIVPIDVHVMRVGSQLKLITENHKPNWETATYLTERLKDFDNNDPVKYDLALFSLGIEKKSSSIYKMK